jgi:acetyltransferase-like isoleucine patch superfamily enzyme
MPLSKGERTVKECLALLTRGRWWKIHSFIIALLLKASGVRVGHNFHIMGNPRLKIQGRPENIIIGDNVRISGDVDIRNRENGKLIIGNDVTIENDCRFVAAREGRISIGEQTVIGAFAVFNGGGDIVIGRKCIFAVRASINANEHLMARGGCIKDQGFRHASVIIEDDCWIGANVAINKGVAIARGSVVGANAVVTKSTDPYSINVGIPARKIGERS